MVINKELKNSLTAVIHPVEAIVKWNEVAGEVREGGIAYMSWKVRAAFRREEELVAHYLSTCHDR